MSSIFNDVKVWCRELDDYLIESVQTTSSIPPTTAFKMKQHLNKIMCSIDGGDIDQNKTLMLDILFTLIMKFQNWMDCFLESSFIYQHIMPFLDHLFNTEGKLVGRVGEPIVAGHGYNNNSSTNMMTDYTLSYEYDPHHYFDLFVVEVKPPKKSSYSQLQSDYVKLGKEMKMMMDTLINKNIEGASVCGLLVEGYNCTTYSMDLNYDGVYRMVQLGKFHLLREPSDLVLVP